MLLRVLRPRTLGAVLASSPIVQMCWAVADLESAVDQWVSATGAGPFFVAPHIAFDELTYRGQPATLDQSSAVGQWGAVQVELFEQHCDSPSAAREIGTGVLQHVCWVAADFDAEAARLVGLGYAEVMACRLPAMAAMRLAWYDTRPVLGCFAEIYEESARMRRMYQRVAAAAVGWDGTDPLRSF